MSQIGLLEKSYIDLLPKVLLLNRAPLKPDPYFPKITFKPAKDLVRDGIKYKCRTVRVPVELLGKITTEGEFAVPLPQSLARRIGIDSIDIGAMAEVAVNGTVIYDWKVCVECGKGKK